jgi:hypothetical protein
MLTVAQSRADDANSRTRPAPTDPVTEAGRSGGVRRAMFPFVRWPTQFVAYGLIATMGVGCGLFAAGGNNSQGHEVAGPALTANRITGDPPVFASIEVLPEGSNPQGTVVSGLDVAIRDDLPEPVVDTTCGGYGVGVRLKSGRNLHYSPCAMPPEIKELRDSLLRSAAP